MRGEQLYESAQRHLIGGAGAGGRVHPLLKRPLYLARGKGSRFWDVDGNRSSIPTSPALPIGCIAASARRSRSRASPGWSRGSARASVSTWV